ncbi:choice-of-anchor J family PEP-CTERM protein [Massilia sp. S19_KUP03_FR1]|uniref:choice-of-anchor J family PEP-CTERM protein n=1 Tax=Massilia sp. S19_KUP03_FR1 TaxID=3025503 RepID=UPI002FCDBD5E
MKIPSLLSAGALALALLAPGAQAATGTTVLNEGFDDVNALAGWSQYNFSEPQGQGWFQGSAGIFAAQAGSAGSYVATNFLGAQDGAGSVDSWLISPLLNLTGTTELSFFTRTAGTPGYRDQLEVRFDAGFGTFDTLLATVGGIEAYPVSWTALTASVNLEGSGRFAFRYLGDASALDYIGVDTVKVMTAVPEPSSWLMLVLGLAGVGALRRKFT